MIQHEYFDYVSRQLRLLRGCLWRAQHSDQAGLRKLSRQKSELFLNGSSSV